LGHSHIQDEMMKRVITLLVWKGGWSLKIQSLFRKEKGTLLFCLHTQNCGGKYQQEAGPCVAGSHSIDSPPPPRSRQAVASTESSYGPFCMHVTERGRREFGFYGQKAILTFPYLQLQQRYSFLLLQNSEFRKTCNLSWPLFVWARDKSESYFLTSVCL
jgi:hypothetical protein